MILEKTRKDILDKINKGTFNNRFKLPTIREFAKEFSVSPVSVRRAIKLLEDDGILISVQGKGIFLREKVPFINRKKGKTLALSLMMKPVQKEVYKVQDRLIDEGWLLYLYNVEEDRQDPVKERKFLKSVEKEGLAGVAIFPSPHPPTNAELFNRFRLMGIKVLIMAPYKEDLSKENFLLFDLKKSGYLSTTQMHIKGYKNVIFACSHALGGFNEQSLSGVKEAINDYNLNLFDIIYPYVSEEDNCLFETTNLEGKYNSREEYIERIPPNTVIISNNEDFGTFIAKNLKKSARNFPEDVGVCLSCNTQSYSKDFTGAEFSNLEWLNQGIDYLKDDNIASTDVYQHWLQPKFVFGNTTR